MNGPLMVEDAVVLDRLSRRWQARQEGRPPPVDPAAREVRMSVAYLVLALLVLVPVLLLVLMGDVVGAGQLLGKLLVILLGAFLIVHALLYILRKLTRNGSEQNGEPQ